MNNTLFDRLRVQSVLRQILTKYPDEGYAIIAQALEKEIQYEQRKKSHAYSNRHSVIDNSMCRNKPTS
jgi:hypothetical protein